MGIYHYFHCYYYCFTLSYPLLSSSSTSAPFPSSRVSYLYLFFILFFCFFLSSYIATFISITIVHSPFTRFSPPLHRLRRAPQRADIHDAHDDNESGHGAPLPPTTNPALFILARGRRANSVFRAVPPRVGRDS